jgi:hypothetical protein
VNGYEIDRLAGKLYWLTPTNIQRANLDGSGIEDLIAFEYPGQWSTDSLSLDLINPVEEITVPEPNALLLAVLGSAVIFGLIRNSTLPGQVLGSRRDGSVGQDRYTVSGTGIDA